MDVSVVMAASKPCSGDAFWSIERQLCLLKGTASIIRLNCPFVFPFSRMEEFKRLEREAREAEMRPGGEHTGDLNVSTALTLLQSSALK
jgi:hypothetical protein